MRVRRTQEELEAKKERLAAMKVEHAQNTENAKLEAIDKKYKMVKFFEQQKLCVY